MKKKLSQILENKTEIYTKNTKEKRLGDAPADPKDQVKLGSKTEIGLNPTITGHQPFSQSTLQAKSQPYDKATSQEEIDKLINYYANLNSEHRREFINYLEKTFNDSAWAKKGAGVPSDRKGYHKEETETLCEALEEIGFSEESQAKCEQLFMEMVVRRVNDELELHHDQQHPFRQKLMELLQNYSPHPFQDISEMERLALKVENLEGHLALIEAQSQKLRQENYLREEKIFLNQVAKTEKRRPIKSVLEETMLTPDEDAFFNQEEKHINPQMRKYLPGGRLWGIPGGE